MPGLSFEHTRLKYKGKNVATINRFTKEELSKIAKTFNNKGQIIETEEIDGGLYITSLFREGTGNDMVVELSGHEEVKYAAMKSKHNEKWFPVIYDSPPNTRMFALMLVEKPQGYLVIAAHPGFPTKPSPTDSNIQSNQDLVEDAEYYWKNHAFCAPTCFEVGILNKPSETEEIPW